MNTSPFIFKIRSLDGVIESATDNYNTALKYARNRDYYAVHQETGLAFCGCTELTLEALTLMIVDVRRIQAKEKSEAECKSERDSPYGLGNSESCTQSN